jgi:TatD DNase family protein
VIDTHAHVDVCADPPESVLVRASAAGVRRTITVGTDIESCRAALVIAESRSEVFASLGIHPHAAGGADAARIGELRELLGHARAVAVGETGLDHYRDYAPHDAQQGLFEEQLALAADLALPIVIHTRSAVADTAAMLAQFEGTVILHCFSEPELLDVALDRGYYVSFAGNVTYPGADALRAAARAVPADRILAETDSPYLAPVPFRGRPCEPAYVVHTLEALARVRGVKPAELEAQIDANADRAFSLP